MESLVTGLEFAVGNVVGECYTYKPSEDYALGISMGGLSSSPPASPIRISPIRIAPQKQQQPATLVDRPQTGAAAAAAAAVDQHQTEGDDDGDDDDDEYGGSGVGSSSGSVANGASSSPQQRKPKPKPKPKPTAVASPRGSPGSGAGLAWTTKVERPCEAIRSLFPYLLVSIGSGVSIICVDGPGKHRRVSGSSIGGGTFFGLARAVCGGCPSEEDGGNGGREIMFHELLEMAQRGDSTTCDMMVGDIYGHDYGKIGLSSDVVASSFGKIATARVGGGGTGGGGSAENGGGGIGRKPEDRVRALLMMVTNNIAQIAYLNAQLFKTSRIYFVGNFLRHNQISCHRLSFAIDYWSRSDMEAIFLEHEGYFGALGAFITAR